MGLPYPGGPAIGELARKGRATISLPRPMLGYCRSGARSTAIYQATAHIRN